VLGRLAGHLGGQVGEARTVVVDSAAIGRTSSSERLVIRRFDVTLSALAALSATYVRSEAAMPNSG